MRHTLFFFLLVLLSGCDRLSTSRPICDASFAGELPVDTSWLSTPVVIPMHLIEEKMNRAIRQDLVEDDDFENRRGGKKDKLKLRVTRLGNISIHWKNNVATYDAPLLVLIEKEIVSKKVLPLTKPLALKTEFSLRLVFETAVRVGEDWRLEPHTKFRDFEWLSEVKVLGGLIDIKKPVERRLRKQLPFVETTLDSVIRASVRLDRTMSRVWQKLQKPSIINKQGEKMWVQFHPIRFEMGRIISQDTELMIEGRVSATTQTLMGENPVYAVDSVLPPLVRRDSLPNEAFIHLIAEIPYKEINKMLADKLADKELKMQNRNVRIKSAEVWGCGDKLMLRLRVHGALRGDVYFQGLPSYDADSQRIVIRDFDYELRTQEALLAGADWLLHERFKEEVGAKLMLPIQEKIELMPSLIELGIERKRAGRKLELSIEDWDFRPQRVWVRQFDLALAVTIRARARVELEAI